MSRHPQSVAALRPAPWPHYAEDERAAVQNVLASGRVNYWTGEETRRFEAEYAASCDTRHGIALANGTVALELALRVFGIGPGDEVITTPRTFIASASCVVLCGAVPVFADVDPESQNITAASIERRLSPRTRAIIVVHLGGWPCDMEPIMALARARGLIVIEDCAQANGASYRGKPVGGLGHAGAFSFCQDKIITTGGEGGMLTTSDEARWSQAWSFKDHGKSYDAVYRREHPPGFRWLHESFGTNWRMTEIQAAIGRRQLAKLPVWIDARTKNAARLRGALAGNEAVRVPQPPPHIKHAYYRFYLFVRPERLKPGWSRDRIVAQISDSGVPCFSGSCSEIYLEKAFQGTQLAPAERLPVARELGETSIAMLVHPTLTESDVTRACDVLCRTIREAAA